MNARMKQYHRDWHKKQSPARKQRKRDLQLKRIRENVLWVRSYKSNIGCSCGERDWRCLDFHHLGDKIDNISNMSGQGVSQQNLLKEMEKCIILCANCHRKETFEL